MQRKDVQAVLTTALVYLAMEAMGVTCPIRFVTGVSCAGCGMSRAWVALLRRDVSAAFAYHPLFWLPVPAAVMLWSRRRMPEWAFRWGMAAAAALFLVVYAIRLFSPGDEVVTFAPSQGAVWRLVSALRALR